MPLTTPNTASLPGLNSPWSLPRSPDLAQPALPSAPIERAASAIATVARHHIAALDARFPSALHGCVPELFAAGDLATWDALLAACGPAAPSPAARPLRVTIVGSRAASDVGLRRAHELGQALAKQGAVVLSGGALGIDAAAHQGALSGDGQSWAVLGSGLDCLYPRRHLPLFAQLVQRGLLLSSFPHSAPPRAQHFPKRNQVMAALCDVVVVIEAALSSGTRYTANAAARLGRPVLCFPSSPGTMALVQGGAHAVHSIADALDQLRDLSAGSRPLLTRARPASPATVPPRPTQPECEGPALSREAARVLSLLSQPQVASQGCDVSELSALSGLPVAACAAAVIELELFGCCSRLPGGRYMGRASL